MIACVRVPFFAAEIERLWRPGLGEAPLAINDGQWVHAVSKEVTTAGVRPGMTTRQALALCPGARFIPAAHARGVPRETVEAVFLLLVAFAGYAFPKSHAAAFAVIARRAAALDLG